MALLHQSPNTLALRFRLDATCFIITLADLYAKEGNYRDSAAQYALALDGLRQSSEFGPAHPRTTLTASFVADAIAKQGRLDLAVEEAQSALEAIDLEKEPFDYIPTYSLLYRVATESESPSLEKGVGEKIKTHVIRHHGERPELAVAIFNTIASDLVLNGLRELAARVAIEAQRIGSESLNDSHPQMRRTITLAKHASKEDAKRAKSAVILVPAIRELLLQTGKQATVSFRVLHAGGQTNLYLNSLQNYEDENCVTVFVQANHLPVVQDLGVGDPWSELIGRVIRVRATIGFRNGRISIPVTEPGQLTVLSDAEVQTLEAELAAKTK